MARKGSKTGKHTGEVAGKGTPPGPGSERPAGGPGKDASNAPGRGLSPEELGGAAAGATRIRIKVDFADLRGPEDVD